jgi:Ni,Fe-hydrogenase III large subunit/Ni,Fe-hydrogenase III component G
MTGVRRSVEIAAAELHDQAARLLEAGHRLALVAGHDDGDALRVVYVFVAGPPDRRVELIVRLDPSDPSVPTLSDLSFPASRFERELHDSFGVIPVGHPFLRPLVRHQHWPPEWHPMRRDAGRVPPMREDAAPYPFVEVGGTGVYEIPVGPVHAGLIEPGHFRFTVVGETILKMTARLWYLHRGVERMFQGLEASAGVAVAERISGDSAVGHALAYCLAVEEARGIEVPADARDLRALLLELERTYNHVGDLGAMCNDVGFGVANARALTIREELLRLNEEVTGHRLLRGAIAPGTTTVRAVPSPERLAGVAGDVDALVAMILAHTVVVDRFEGTAVLSAEDARAIGTLGVVARASGLDHDARAAHPFVDEVDAFRVARQGAGDVLARFTQRVEELRVSLAMAAELVRRVPSPAPSASPGEHRGSGLGIVEGWRGAVVHRVELDSRGVVTRCRALDPSFHNWPALAVSLADTIVPDFPLVNKSFNLSYAGNDL